MSITARHQDEYFKEVDILNGYDLSLFAKTEHMDENTDSSWIIPVIESLRELCEGVNPDILFALGPTSYRESVLLVRRINAITARIVRAPMGSPNAHVERINAKNEFQKVEAAAWNALVNAKSVFLIRFMNGDVYTTKFKALDATYELGKQKLEQLFSSYSSLLPEAAINIGANDLEKDATAQEGSSRWWFMAICATASMIAISFFVMYFSGDTVKSDKEIAYTVANRLIWFGFLFTLLVFCTRNYSAHVHNHLVVKHRVTALRVYRAIVAAAGSADGRETILKHAADCIFSQQPTGFGKGESNDTPSVFNSVISNLKGDK